MAFNHPENRSALLLCADRRVKGKANAQYSEGRVKVALRG
jgi:hypothetical protein